VPHPAPVRAAGGLVWRRGADGQTEVLLIHRPVQDDWTLPKGTCHDGEADEDCALREVQEETGLRCRLGDELPTVRYVDATGQPKRVRYWAMPAVDGSFAPNEEVDETRWCSVSEAVETLTYPKDREVLHAFIAARPGAARGDGAPLWTWRPTPNDPADWFSAEELDRARRYQRPLKVLQLVRAGLGLTVLLVFIFGQLGGRLTDGLGIGHWAGALVVVFLALNLASLIYDVPLDAWLDLRYDRRWGLSTQTGKGLAADQVKSFLVSMVLGAALLIPLYAIIRATDWWWLLGWALVVAFSIVAGFLFPVVIAPIFNKFAPLDDEALAARIRRVADASGARISDIRVADESRRSRRDNAYVAGLGRTRRIVLYDTLLEHPHEVVEQVAAHEIGHWRLRHLARQIPVAAVLTLAVFAGLALLERFTWVFDRAGLDPELGFGDPASLPLLIFAVQIGFTVVGLITGWMSRAFERQADLEALDVLRDPAQLIEMHRRLHVKNLADLDPGRLKRIMATHPPPAERMAFAATWAHHHRDDDGQGS
jgi:STE24 endopeptidase